MEISDEYRRRVAAWMRGESEAWRDTFPSTTFDDDDGAIVFDISFALFEEAPTVSEFLARLADLIDRPTCENIADPYDGSFFECSKCGERWELTCGSPADNNLCFCPRCGAEVVG